VNDLQCVINDISEESREDYVGFWVIVWHVHREFAKADDQKVKDLALNILRILLSEYEIFIGQFERDEDKFRPWDCTPDEAVDRVDKEWGKLGREPNISEIAWLVGEWASPHFIKSEE
jgi:hypothetical protein